MNRTCFLRTSHRSGRARDVPLAVLREGRYVVLDRTLEAKPGDLVGVFRRGVTFNDGPLGGWSDGAPLQLSPVLEVAP